MRTRTLLLGLAALAPALLACRQDMHDQPKYEPLEASRFFADGQASRPLPAGTVARGSVGADSAYARGVDSEGRFVGDFPVWVDAPLLRRGRERYDVFCSPCHDRVGTGRGMIVRRGFKQPPSFHDPRLVAAPPGYVFDVISNGFATMPSYAAQVPVADRWAIVAYLRALQLSQAAPLADVPAAERGKLDAEPAAAPAPAAPAGGAPR